MNDIVLETQNRKILASSRESAEKFAKNHDKVCRDIRNLLKFQPTKLAIEYINCLNDLFCQVGNDLLQTFI